MRLRRLAPSTWLRFLVRSVRDWPAMRAATAQWPRWAVRQLLMPLYPITCTITTRRGTRYRLTADRVDDAILRSICAKDRSLYFPPLIGPDVEGVILDIGAHHGIYVIEALRQFPRCRAIAVEPDPAACEQLAHHVAFNGLDARVRIVNAGLAAFVGTGHLEPDPAGSWATVVRAQDPTPARADSAGAVRVLTLDAILAGEHPVMVKCNAEGAEFTFVEQMVTLGLRPALIVLMVHPAFGSARSLQVRLEQSGYLVRDVDRPPRGGRFHAIWRDTIRDTQSSRYT